MANLGASAGASLNRMHPTDAAAIFRTQGFHLLAMERVKFVESRCKSMNKSEIAEHDRLYPLRRSDESADAFLRRCIMEHRLSHELWIETLRNKPELATEATCGMAYQQRAVHRYDEMFSALEEITGREVKPPRVGTFPPTGTRIL